VLLHSDRSGVLVLDACATREMTRPAVDLRSLTRRLAADLLESESLGKKPSRATRKERLPEPGVLAYSARVASSRAPFFSFQLPSRSHFPFTTE
jgi:hypothetical protein